MSADIHLTGLPLATTDIEVAAAFAVWCGTDVAELCSVPSVHVKLHSRSTGGGPRAAELRAVGVIADTPGAVRLTLSLQDAFTHAVARGFAVAFARSHGAEARCAVTGELLYRPPPAWPPFVPSPARLRELCAAAELGACEALYDEDLGAWFVRPLRGEVSALAAEVYFTLPEPWDGSDAVAGARTRLFAAAPTAIPALLDLLDSYRPPAGIDGEVGEK